MRFPNFPFLFHRFFTWRGLFCNDMVAQTPLMRNLHGELTCETCVFVCQSAFFDLRPFLNVDIRDLNLISMKHPNIELRPLSIRGTVSVARPAFEHQGFGSITTRFCPTIRCSALRSQWQFHLLLKEFFYQTV